MTTTTLPEPTFAGLAARAWLVDTTPREGDPPDWSATVRAYHVDAPGAHPLWHWYMIGVVHLRPIAGVRAAHRRSELATHELLVLAFDPKKPPTPGQIPTSASYLQPADVIEQLDELTDEQATQLLDLAVRAVCDGHLSPDQDFRRLWHEMMQGTAAHLRAGLHRPS